jgi:hypothetical protein
MKTEKFVSILILVLAVLSIAGSCATDKKMTMNYAKEEICGTWSNPEYKKSVGPPWPKLVKYPDGTWIIYRIKGAWEEEVETTEDGFVKGSVGKYTIEDKWTDSDGTIWYKVIGTGGLAATYYELYKISNSGKTMEWIYSNYDFPSEINPNHARYHLFYHQ